MKPHSGWFMDFQTQTMASAVEESLHTAIMSPRFITLARKEFLNVFMDFGRGHGSAHSAEGDLLALLYSRVKLPDRFTGAAAHDGASNIAEIAGFLRAGKDVNNNRLIGAQLAMT